MSSLKITIWGKTVGYLAWDRIQNRTILELDADYQNNTINISPPLINKKIKIQSSPVQEPIFQGLHPTFADSLPDYFGNRIFQTWLQQNQIETNDLNPIEKLLYIGKRGSGAFDYEPGKELIHSMETIDFNEIIAISEKIISNKYAISDFLENQQALQNILTIGSSVGGAQAKILIAIHSETGKICAGDILQKDASWEYYIVKLSHQSDTNWGKEKNTIEYVYYLMAKEAKLTISDSELIEINGNYHFKTKRFDRMNGEKIHLQTLLAITGFFSKTTAFSYEQFFGIAEQLTLKQSEKEALFRQMVFNVASCNMDDHLKNFSFLMNQKGEWSLAPAYDLTYPFDPYLPRFQFHKMTINSKSKNIEHSDLMIVAKKVGIKKGEKIIKEVCDAVSKFNSYVKNYEISNLAKEVIRTDIELSLKRLRNS